MEKRKIKDLFKYLPKAKHKAGEGLEVGEYPFYTSSAVVNKYFKEYDYEPNKLIFATGGSASVHYADSRFAVSTDNFILEPNDGINAKYVYYYLKSNIGILQNGFHGAGLQHLSKDYLSDIDIPIISPDQQQKIVDILDKADEIRTKKRIANDKLDEFLKSTFISMFGDPVKNNKNFNKIVLQDIGSFKNGINYNAGDSGYTLKCIGVGDFKNGIMLNSINNLNIVNINQMPNEEYFLRKNDIVFVRSNGSKELVGRTLLVNADLQENIVYSGFCIRLRVEQESINNIFLLQLLNSKSIKDNMKNDGHGCNIKSLNQTILGNIPIIVPPIEEQNKFAQIVEKVEAQKQKNEQVIEQMDNLFNSLSQRAFKGEL